MSLVAPYQFMLVLLLWCLDMIIKIIEAEFISKSFGIIKKLKNKRRRVGSEEQSRFEGESYL